MDFENFYLEVGGSYQDALKRLMNDALLKKFILKFKDDPSFTNLKNALSINDIEVSFREAHTLKSVAYNMAFNRLGDAASLLTELLRNKTIADVDLEKVKLHLIDVEKEYIHVIESIDRHLTLV